MRRSIVLFAGLIGACGEPPGPSEDSGPKGGDSFAPIVDGDGDGWTVADGDCDDADAAVHPGVDELCNGVDDNCDAVVDEGWSDLDGDGAIDCDGLEPCDGVDNDEDGYVDEDSPDTDGDGVADCRDAEDCDGLDNDGNGLVDDVPDGDGDGVDACADCDDADATVYPGADDVTDGIDEDCDGFADEESWLGLLRITEVMVNPQMVADPEGEWVELQNIGSTTLVLDGLTVEADGVDQIGGGLPHTVEPGGYVVIGGSLAPDLNGGVDEAWAWTGLTLHNSGGTFSLYAADVLLDSVTWGEVDAGASWGLDQPSLEGGDAVWCSSPDPISDESGDFGTPGAENGLCADVDHDGDGWTREAGDCDDADPITYPGAPDAWYDGLDNDCAGNDDMDQDADGSDVGVDCDDLDPTATPGNLEVCGGVDEDCDGLVDDDDPDVHGRTWYYPDDDGDGFGQTVAGRPRCVAPAGWAVNGEDCDDTDALVNPGLAEVCGNGLDDNCSGTDDSCSFDGATKLQVGKGVLDLLGTASSDHAGNALADAGDADGDGVHELLVGAYTAADGASDGGAVYIVPGTGTTEGYLFDAGGVVTGTAAGDELGWALAGGADLDGDGALDFAAGAPYADGRKSDAGVVYILPAATSTLGDAEALATARVLGATANDHLGTAVAVVDADGDGVSDLLVGATGVDDAALNAGTVYVLAGPLVGDVDVSSALTTWTGVDGYDDAGAALAGGDDLTGDGVDDLVIGAPQVEVGTQNGAAYVVSTAERGVVSLADADAGFIGQDVGDQLGTAAALPGDVDGDGYGDLLLGAPYAAGGSSNAGRTYLWYGPFSGTTLSDLAPAVWYGNSSNRYCGDSMAPLGDLDEDGKADFVFGADGSYGYAFVVYGDAFSGSWSGTATDAVDAYYYGYSSSYGLGSALAGGVDWSGDGQPDLAIGAASLDESGADVGGVFVIQGGSGP